MTLRVGIGHFPVSADVASNLRYIRRQIASASRQSAGVVLFPESALDGYPGIDFDSFADHDWHQLERAKGTIQAAAADNRIWVVVGSSHRYGSRGKPFNSLFAMGPDGRTVERYDKRLLARNELEHYRAGDHPATVSIGGVLCGLLVCHEWRYPEVYRQYKMLGVDVVLQAWYDGNYTARQMDANGDLYAEVIPASVQGHAVTNCMWICGANTAARESCFGGFVVRPDGSFLKRQQRHRPGVMVCDVDTGAVKSDPAAHGRERAAALLAATTD